MATTINSNTTDGIVITPDTSGEIHLQANGVTKAKVTANGLQDANGASLRGGSFRNLIINGDMSIAQRGTSASGITTVGYYTVDRWIMQLASAGTWTMSQDTDVPTGQGFSNSLKWQCTSSTATPTYNVFWYKIEGQNLQHLKKGTVNAEPVTLSFWIKSNKTGTYQVNLRDVDNARIIGATYTISSANTWEKKTITYIGDTTGAFDNNNAESLNIEWWFATNATYSGGTVPTSWETESNNDRAAGLTVNIADSTSNYINITGVQLEVGSGASDFEFLPYDVQLARCQRYYLAATFQIQGAFDSAYNTEGIQIDFPVTMRAGPSVDSYSYNKAGHIGGSNTSNPANDGIALTAFSGTFRWNNSSAAYRPYGYVGAITVNLSAEL